ncbi:MAG: hypothetical protein WDN48_05910 [Pseudolabrys sp.]
MSELKNVIAAIGAILDAKTESETAVAVQNAREVAESTIDMLESTISSDNKLIDKLEEVAEGKSGDIADAVDQFLDEVERPVGTLDFTIPKTKAVSRAVLRLYDSVNRNL